MNAPKKIHRLTFELGFPAGLAAGKGSSGNNIAFSRNGMERPVLRGTSLAGILRAAWRKTYGSGDIEKYFGSAADTGTPSALSVPDVVLDFGKDGETLYRTFHHRNRHTGAVLDGGLFSIETAPPDTKGNVTLWLRDDGKLSGKEFFGKLAGILERGLIFGGNGNRGIGLGEVKDGFQYREYNFADVDYLSDHYAWREGTIPSGDEKNNLVPIFPDSTNLLRIDLTLEIPRGQDLLVGDGQGIDADSEPQCLRDENGKPKKWLLPGSTLHGLFRGWITRLAAREGKIVSDSVEKSQEKATGDIIGWMFAKNRRDDDSFVDEIEKTYPVESLFGSLHKAGRIHIADSYCDADQNDTQHRMHVALDAISGGAIEHLLFDNMVLTKGTFPVTIIVENPKEYEVEWIAQTIRALDHGLLRVGASKSAGRLALKGPFTAKGDWHEKLTPKQEGEVR